MLNDDCIIGGMIPKHGELQWFVTNLTMKKKVRVSLKSLKKRKVFVKYPWFIYTGLFPDNREMVIANLADDDCP